jgi:hypothetical protein
MEVDSLEALVGLQGFVDSESVTVSHLVLVKIELYQHRAVLYPRSQPSATLFEERSFEFRDFTVLRSQVLSCREVKNKVRVSTPRDIYFP